MIIAERNNGGDMVEFTIRTVDSTVPVKTVWASRGKRTRAEPVAALYEQGKVHHVGAFPELETQQCEWLPGEKSPDRMDALVWVLTDLLVDADAPPIQTRPVKINYGRRNPQRLTRY
jgi:phage terminase large subunit-like protein